MSAGRAKIGLKEVILCHEVMEQALQKEAAQVQVKASGGEKEAEEEEIRVIGQAPVPTVCAFVLYAEQPVLIKPGCHVIK